MKPLMNPDGTVDIPEEKSSTTNKSAAVKNLQL